jgi:hypothetical protein
MNRLLNRILIIELFILICLLFPGCTYNRNAPLIQRTAPLIDIHDNANGSANGNTVTPTGL